MAIFGNKTKGNFNRFAQYALWAAASVAVAGVVIGVLAATHGAGLIALPAAPAIVSAMGIGGVGILSGPAALAVFAGVGAVVTGALGYGAKRAADSYQKQALDEKILSGEYEVKHKETITTTTSVGISGQEVKVTSEGVKSNKGSNNKNPSEEVSAAEAKGLEGREDRSASH